MLLDITLTYLQNGSLIFLPKLYVNWQKLRKDLEVKAGLLRNPVYGNSSCYMTVQAQT